MLCCLIPPFFTFCPQFSTSFSYALFAPFFEGILKTSKLVLEERKPLSWILANPFYWLDRYQRSCGLVLHDFDVIVFTELKIWTLKSPELCFLFKTLVFCDIFVLLGGFIGSCFLNCGRIFLPKIVNDLKRLLFGFEIIKLLSSQDNCTYFHEKVFYQNVNK